MQYLSEEDNNRDMHDALSALAHVQESPLQDVTFESMVATLPVVLDYSRAITDRTWERDTSGDSHGPPRDTSTHTGGEEVVVIGDGTSTGERDTRKNQMFSQEVSHRENTRTPVIQQAVSKLLQVRVDKDTGTGPGQRGVVSQQIKEAIRDFGESSGSALHQTHHLQQG
jgi:hypothetical protein